MNPWIPHLLRASGGGGGVVLPPAGRTFLTSKSSLILEEGTGGPTWSRATEAWRFNDQGYLRKLPSGCAEFGGARLVTNLCPTPSNTLAVAGTKTVTLTAAATLQFSMGAGTGTSTFSGTGGATGTLAAGSGRVSVNKTVTAGTFIVTASVADLVDLSIVDVTGKDSAYIPEYVSVGSDTNKNFLLHTDDFSQAAWSKTNITLTQSAIANPVDGLINAQKLEATATAAAQLIQTVSNVGRSAGNILVCYAKQGSGVSDGNRFVLRNTTTSVDLIGIILNYSTGSFTYTSGSSGATVTDAGNGWWKIKLEVTTGISLNDSIRVYICFSGASETAGEFCYIYRPYLGAGITAPAVIPAVAGVWDPFGAGIDGAKYFKTDWQGAPIPAANLLGFRRESAAINSLAYSRNLSSGAYFSSELTGTPEILTNGDLSAGATSWTVTGTDATHVATFSGGTLRFQSDTTSPTLTISQPNVLTVGETYTVTIILSAFTSGLLKSDYFNFAPVVSSVTSLTKTFTGVAASTTFGFTRSSANVDVTINSISVKLAAVTLAQTATGLDGIANSATTITARQDNATILQAVNIVSAARCSSAYVKRRTGTGTISFTQDGGSTWTDITALINSSTWSRVQLTSTLANPSVGFKIGTSGDAIDADVVQNEAGSVATSPIVTTTATVTRNAESLTYQTAGNIGFAVGTIVGSIRSTVTTGSRYITKIGSSGSYTISSTPWSTTWRAYDGTNSVDKTLLSSIETVARKRAVSWGGAGLKSTGDGLIPASGSFDGAFGDGATLDIGSGITGYIGDVAIYNYQMTDAELQAITT